MSQQVVPAFLDPLIIMAYRSVTDMTISTDRATNGSLLAEFYMGQCRNKEFGELTHVVLKVVPKKRYVRSYRELYENELYFYNDILPVLKQLQKEKAIERPFANYPRFFGSFLELDREAIAFEDLRKAGYTCHVPTQYLTDEHLKLIFTTYAKFHALSLVCKHENSELFDGWIRDTKDVRNSIDDRAIETAIETAFEMALGCFDNDDSGDNNRDSEIVRKMRNLGSIESIMTKMRNYSGDYACLIHGDCLLCNMLFQYQDSGEVKNVKIIDFQMIRTGSPVFDLSFFFYSGASKVDLNQTDSYLNLYYSTLANFVRKSSVDPSLLYPREAFRDEWRAYSITGIIRGMGSWTKRLMSHDEMTDLMSKDLSKEKYAEHWNEKLTHVYHIFRERSRDLYTHAADNGII